MPIRIKREDFLSKLQSVSPGLAPKEILEQSSSFIFVNGRVYCFNEEICCQIKSGLDKKFTGVVKAKPLMAILEKYPDDEIDIEITDKSFNLVGAGRKRLTEMALDTQVSEQMNIAEAVGSPTDWKPLHKDFCLAVDTVQQCAKRIAAPNEFVLTCVHIHPKWVEAADDYQFCRWKLKTGISQSTVVRYSSILHISKFGMEEMSEGSNWLHFKNKSGLLLSCRKWTEEYVYPSADQFLKEPGTPTKFPKGLASAADACQVFSSEDSSNVSNLLVELTKNEVRVVGLGTSGKHTEKRNKGVSYEGRSLSFYIPPKLLMSVVEKHQDFILTENKLRVEGDSWSYFTVLGIPSDDNGVQEKPAEEEPSEEADEPIKVKPKVKKKPKHQEEE